MVKHPVSASNYMLLLLLLSIKTKFSLPFFNEWMERSFLYNNKKLSAQLAELLKIKLHLGE